MLNGIRNCVTTQNGASFSLAVSRQDCLQRECHDHGPEPAQDIWAFHLQSQGGMGEGVHGGVVGARSRAEFAAGGPVRLSHWP